MRAVKKAGDRTGAPESWPVVAILPARRLAAGSRDTIARAVANEVPVALSYNGIAHVVMMLTPADYEDFAVGFSLSEGIVDGPEEVEAVEVRTGEAGMLVDLSIPRSRFEALIRRRRNLVGQSNCGVCGLEELEEAVRTLPPLDTAPQLTRGAIDRALDELPRHQPLNAETGAVHAAAFCDPSGRILAVREDIGRHNAFDKLIGALARGPFDAGEGFALLTSRCSFELVEKAVMARIPALVTVSAPTGLAIELARRARLTLVALARADSMLCFHDPHGLFGAVAE
ncbi:MAG: formate dehydrogenase accessory sulfurtransferase FdhD [Alphaproteobacteria bacterium]|nr:MAG: formate dehydrogenase accessory sulfurtransferase FdhD [Alphaproteobacteria bacterium]